MIPVYNFGGSVSIVNLGDVHRGSHNCDVDLLRKHIKRIAKNDDVYWLSTGDLCETATKGSVSTPYDADSPESEVEALAEELAPIRHKCLGFVASNHHRRVHKESGISMDKYLAAVAGLPYLGKSAVIKITCGRLAYFCKLHHGVGGGRLDGGKINSAVRLAQNTLGCDVYFTGHTHTFAHLTDVQTIVDRKRDKLVDITTHYVVTAHYLSYKDSYADDIGYKEKPKGCAVVHLKGNKTGNQDNKRIVVDFWGK